MVTVTLNTTVAREIVQSALDEMVIEMNNLDDFIASDARYAALSEVQRGLLVAQAQAMNTYATILNLRLEHWS